MLTLRPMSGQDLPLVEAWLQLPHIARWWTVDTTAEAVIARYRERIDAARPATHMLIVAHYGTPIGWCQWFRWADYPEDAAAIQASASEVGIDYAIGEPGAIGRGLGTEMVSELVGEVRRHHPGKGILVDPARCNLASRRVLEKNGFVFVANCSVAKPPAGQVAVFRFNPSQQFAPPG